MLASQERLIGPASSVGALQVVPPLDEETKPDVELAGRGGAVGHRVEVVGEREARERTRTCAVDREAGDEVVHAAVVGSIGIAPPRSRSTPSVDVLMTMSLDGAAVRKRQSCQTT